jgi:Natural resistance-associated macrophage protein
LGFCYSLSSRPRHGRSRSSTSRPPCPSSDTRRHSLRSSRISQPSSTMSDEKRGTLPPIVRNLDGKFHVKTVERRESDPPSLETPSFDFGFPGKTMAASTTSFDSLNKDLPALPPRLDASRSHSPVMDKLNHAGRTLRKFAKFIGPGFMVAVAYIDPGNYATDAAAGAESQFGLLFMVLLSNLIAIFFQTLCIKMGSVTGGTLAQVCRDNMPKWMTWSLYVISEAAIIATDVAEVRSLHFDPGFLIGPTGPISLHHSHRAACISSLLTSTGYRHRHCNQPALQDQSNRLRRSHDPGRLLRAALLPTLRPIQIPAALRILHRRSRHHRRHQFLYRT